MRIFTQEEIDYLIHCEKDIASPPKKEGSLTEGHYRNGFDLVSKDGAYRFHVFMRKNAKFEENFTIGLIYCPNDGNPQLPILRCNGPHGVHSNDSLGEDEHFISYHIHRYDEEYYKRGLKSDKYAEETQEYSTYHDALRHFIKICHINDPNDLILSRVRLLKLFD